MEAPGFKADLDQFGAALRDCAGMFSDYFDALIARDFTPEEAMELTVNCQEVVLSAWIERDSGD